MLVIINPCAGRSSASECGKKITAELTRRNINYTAAYTEREAHATEIARGAYHNGERVFVSVGGDGTLHEIINGLPATDVTLGIIPAGSGNDFLRSLNIPRDPMKALEVVLSGNTIQLDLPKCNGEYFLNYCGIGFDVSTVILSNKLKKHFPKSVVYFLALLITLLSFKFKTITIKSDIYRLTKKIFMLNVANGRFFGNGLPFSPESSPSDGILDVCIISKMPRIIIPYMLIYFLKGKHARIKKYVQFLHLSSITLESETKEIIGIDGELSASTPASICLDDHIRIFAPSK